MSSLLSPFNFGQKHAYFHARITIHELVNVPLVTGQFKSRWRVKNGHNLQSIPMSQGEGQHDRESTVGSEDGERKSLHHKKSFASSIASQDNGTSGRDKGKFFKSDQSNDSKGESSRDRKTSNRFLSGFKGAFNNRSRRPDSSSSLSKEVEAEDERHSMEQRTINDWDEEGHDVVERDTARHSTHSKGESYDSGHSQRSKRPSSFNGNASTKLPSLSSRTIEEKESSHFASSHPSSLLNMEPRGETMSEKVKDHSVSWERTIDVGVRIPVDKLKPNEKGSNTTPVATTSGSLTPAANHSGMTSGSEGGASASGSSSAPAARTNYSDNRSLPSHRSLADLKKEEGESRAEKQEKDVKEKEKDREMADAWGMLATTELKVTIKAEISTDATIHHHSDANVTMGYVSINLAEFAPYPESSAHQHQPPHHHHNHHHHHHHHQHSLSRSETRRYLLTDSRTNATLKMTIEMTHVGGTKEYAVPAVRRGLIVAGVTSLMDAASVSGKGAGSGPNSDAGRSSTEGHGNENGRQGQRTSESRYPNSSLNASMSSFQRDPVSAWPSDSVARHVRIPSSNLKTELSHQDAARAVKEAGGQRMGFSFGAGAHHERPPEDVIEALFNPTSSNNASQMLTPSVNRSDRVKGMPNKKKKGGKDSNVVTSEEQENDPPKRNNVYPEKPPHFDGLSPAEHPKDSAQNSGSPLSRFQTENGSFANRPGPDMGRTYSVEGRRASKSSTEHSDDSKKGPSHSRNSSASTMRSILTNSISSKVLPQSIPATTSSSSSGTNHSESPVANNSKSSQLSGRTTNLVHWEANVAKDNHKEGPTTHTSSPLATDKLSIPTPRLTASPSVMSAQISPEDALLPVDSTKEKSIKSTLDLDDTEPSHRTSLDALEPPKTPPDVLRREAIHALDGKNVIEEVQKARKSQGATRGVIGLTKEEALQKGYRGAGWGTMKGLWPSALTDTPSLEEDNGSAPFTVYSGTSTPPSDPTPNREAII